MRRNAKRSRRLKRSRRRRKTQRAGNKKKVLVIIVSSEMNPIFLPNIVILRDFLKDYETDFAAVLSSDEFAKFEGTIPLKYKEVHPKRQFSKTCHFITKYKDQLDYDWYIKIRPDVKLIEPIAFDQCKDSMINARARIYNGPRTIKHGLSAGGSGEGNLAKCYTYNDVEKDIILDDMVWIFGKKLIDAGGFSVADIEEPNMEGEWYITGMWKKNNIPLNVVGVNLHLLYENGEFRNSGTDIPQPN
jgi:hypothetical protein